MTPEMIAIIAVGLTVVGVNLHSSREIRAEMRREFGALGKRIDALSTRIDALSERIDDLAARIGALEQRMVRVEEASEGVLRGRIDLSPAAAE